MRWYGYVLRREDKSVPVKTLEFKVFKVAEEEDDETNVKKREDEIK